MDNWQKLSSLPINELKEVQNRKLRKFISEQVYPFSSYYRNLFDQHKIKPQQIRKVEDLKIIPFTQKEDFLPTADNPTKPRDFILQPDENLIKKYAPKGKLLEIALLKTVKGKENLKKVLQKEYLPIFVTFTTGTTYQPVPFFYSTYDLQNLSLAGFRLLEVFGVKEYGGKGVNLFPYAPHLAFWQTVFAAIAHNDFLLSTGGGKVMGTEKNIDVITKVSPGIIIGEPSYLYHLLRSAAEIKKDFSFVQKIILGANRVPLGLKEKLASLLKSMKVKEIYIFGTYGFTEAKYAWAECPTALDISSGYHTYPDKEIFEVIDPKSGEVKKEGEDGELVYTHLDSRGSCVLRYRTGDLVKGGITYEPCPYCKRTVPRISSDISRASNIQDLMLSKIKGTLVNLNDLDVILSAEKEIEEWQVEIRKRNNDPYEIDELSIYLSITPGMDSRSLKEKLNNQIKAATEISPNEIIILPPREMIERVELEGGFKAKRFVDLRPKI